ncbi:MAG: ATP-binding protein [Candidatus Saccharimonadales bacterium]
MHLVEVVELITSGTAVLLLGLVVLWRSKRQMAFRWFFMLCLAVCSWSWAIGLYTLSQDPSSTLFWANFYYSSSFAISIVLHVFTSYWLDSKHKRLHTSIGGGLMALFLITVLTRPHFIVSAVQIVGGQKTVTLSMFGYGLFSVVFMMLFTSAIIRLFVGAFSLHGLRRLQTRYITASLVCAGSFGVYFNLILPWMGNYDLVWVGPLSTVIFVGVVGYAIVRQKLFDVRRFVLRALAYLLSTVLLSIVFIIPVVLIVAYAIGGQFSVLHFLRGVLVATIFALFYSRIRRAFDSLTNRIFYRKYYEPQAVFNELSEVLVRSIELKYIKQQSAKVIQDAIRTDRVDYWLVGDEGYEGRSPQLLEKLFHHGSSMSNTVLVENQNGSLQSIEYLRELDIAVLVRLRTSSAVLGFLALGFKESGEPYTDRDRRLLNIVSDEIAITLQNALHFEEIKNFNETLQGRIDTATSKLRQTNRKLQALDETKDEFITMASHQLRTPLTSVKGYLSMVLEGDAGSLNAQQKQLLGQSYISSQRMVYLIADLLNLSRLNTGKFVIELSPTNLLEVVQDEIDQLAETIKSRGLELVYNPPNELPQLMLDQTKIHQVVMNFIDNAIYYTPAGGTIEIVLRETPSAIEYLVRDTGIGVPRPEQHKLFTKFYRAKNAKQARPDGTGLGLFMAKKVIAAQGGAIIFDSKEGVGSTFGFRFSKRLHLVPNNRTSDEGDSKV